jgi:hypothetical protein
MVWAPYHEKCTTEAGTSIKDKGTVEWRRLWIHIYKETRNVLKSDYLEDNLHTADIQETVSFWKLQVHHCNDYTTFLFTMFLKENTVMTFVWGLDLNFFWIQASSPTKDEEAQQETDIQIWNSSLSVKGKLVDQTVPLSLLAKHTGHSKAGSCGTLTLHCALQGFSPQEYADCDYLVLPT